METMQRESASGATHGITYEEFLRSKMTQVHPSGFEAVALHPQLKDFQSSIVKWAVHGGRRAIFADTGLGKTLMQLEWARKVSDAHGPVLILAPLAVGPQTVREAAKFGIDGVEFVSEFSQSPIQILKSSSWYF